MENGDFDAVVQNISDFADDPTAQFNTLLSKHTSVSPTPGTVTPSSTIYSSCSRRSLIASSA
jgi:hypothetical protein